MKLIFILLVVCPPILILLFLAWASFPWSTGPKKFEGEIRNLAHIPSHIDEDVTPPVLKVLTWNLSYGYGVGSQGIAYAQKDKDFFEDKIKGMSLLLQKSEADIVFLQEVDFDSSRSARMDQARLLAEASGFRYIAYAPSWVANYIPFPYFPFSNHFGHMNSGGAILSKYPIIDNSVELLAKPDSNPWWYNLFYLHRYLQRTTIKMGEKEIKVLNLHLEAFARLNRQNQAAHLSSIMDHEGIDLVAGDFNMIPSSAVKKSKFAESIDNYENDMSYDILARTKLKDVIPEDIYSKNEALYWTFPANKPNRKLDYFFPNYHFLVQLFFIITS